MTLRIFLQALLSIFLLMLSSRSEANQKIVWGSNKSAVNYEYLISTSKKFEHHLSKGEVTLNEVVPIGLPEGEYFLKVRFKDKWGRLSPYSKVSRIEIRAKKIETPTLPVESKKPPSSFSLSYAPTPFWNITYNGFKISEPTFQNLSLHHHLKVSDYLVKTGLGALGSSKGRGRIYQAHVELEKEPANQFMNYGLRANFVYLNYRFQNESKEVYLKGTIAYVGPTLNVHTSNFDIRSHIGIEKNAKPYVFVEMMSPPFANKLLTTQVGIRYNKIQTKNFEGSISSETISFVFDFLGGK